MEGYTLVSRKRSNLRIPGEINGLQLRLRLVQQEDAGYIHALRTDPAYNLHLSEVQGSADDQRRWIQAYKNREEAGQEAYYVIERRDNVRCGLVRLYDIGADSFTWGSWILDAAKPPKAALECSLLSFGVGFEELNLQRALVDVRVANRKALAFYLRLRMTELRRDVSNVYLAYSRERFRADREGYCAIIGALSEG